MSIQFSGVLVQIRCWFCRFCVGSEILFFWKLLGNIDVAGSWVTLWIVRLKDIWFSFSSYHWLENFPENLKPNLGYREVLYRIEPSSSWFRALCRQHPNASRMNNFHWPRWKMKKKKKKPKINHDFLLGTYVFWLSSTSGSLCFWCDYR